MFKIIALILVLGVVYCAANIPDQNDPKVRASNDKTQCESTSSAYYMSQTFVRKSLKAPATAVFPSYNAEGVSTQFIGDCTHIVRSYVDAQNGFGALIRTTYFAKLKYTGGDYWNIISLDM
jgi:hypothetical protein